MQSFLLRAFSVLAFASLAAPVSAAPGNKIHTRTADKSHHVQQRAIHAHRPVQHFSGVSSGGYAPDMPRPLASAVVSPVAGTLTLPLNPVQLPQRQILGISSDSKAYHEHYASQPLPERRHLELLSGVPMDPDTVLSELPSGRIVMQAPFYGYRSRAYYRQFRANLNPQQPYAQPTFHIIGESSRKHMGTPVKLTYGTDMRRRINPSPRVVWIKEERQGRNIHIVK